MTTVRQNPNYWKEGLPFVDGIEYLVIQDANTRFAAFVTGKIDNKGAVLVVGDQREFHYLLLKYGAQKVFSQCSTFKSPLVSSK